MFRADDLPLSGTNDRIVYAAGVKASKFAEC